jgi:hypothetical protein
MNDFESDLRSRINERIKVRGFCVVYDHDLARICAPEATLRQKQIRVIQKFAAKYGLAVSIRDTGINATFKEPLARDTQKILNGKNGHSSTRGLPPANGIHSS